MALYLLFFCSKPFFSQKREKTIRNFASAKSRGVLHVFGQKKWLRESFSQVNIQKHGAIFCNASTCENGTRRSEGMFEAIFCHFEAIFLILQMAPSSKKWLRKIDFVILSMKMLDYPWIFERGSKMECPLICVEKLYEYSLFCIKVYFYTYCGICGVFMYAANPRWKFR